MTPYWKKRLIGLAFIGVILFIPLVAMQFTNEVKWGWSDFITAGLLLFATALLIELFIRRIPNKTYGLIFIALVLLGVLLLWAELAVGIFGSSFAGD